MTQLDRQTPDVHGLVVFLESLVARIGGLALASEAIRDQDQRAVLASGLSEARAIVLKMLSDLQAQQREGTEAHIIADTP